MLTRQSYHGGAGIYCSYSSALISNCVIRNNSGSGLRCSKSELNVRNCIFTGNRGAYSDYHAETSRGGGIWFLGENISITNCTFSGNAADFGGGVCSYTSSNEMNKMTISNCIFRDNDAN
ncbi:MAG: right-handed parallel beta-helix repeat-containing protein, partial [Planctomycetota bacterium]